MGRSTSPTEGPMSGEASLGSVLGDLEARLRTALAAVVGLVREARRGRIPDSALLGNLRQLCETVSGVNDQLDAVEWQADPPPPPSPPPAVVVRKQAALKEKEKKKKEKKKKEKKEKKKKEKKKKEKIRKRTDQTRSK